MCSEFLFRLCLPAIAIVITLDSAPAKQRKCIYFFETCYSCEAPLTCQNSRPVGTGTSTRPKQRSTVVRSDPPPLPEPKARSIPPSVEKPSADSLVRSQLRKSTDFDREFKQFQNFMRNRQTDGQQPDPQKLQEMYFAYRLWLSKQSRPPGAASN